MLETSSRQQHCDACASRQSCRLTPRYVATDLNQPMLDYARARPGHGQSHPLARSRRADSAGRRCLFRSGVPVRRHVLSRSAFRRSARRATYSGPAEFLFDAWDRIEDNVFADTVTNALATVFPDDPPASWRARRMAITTPRVIRAICQRARLFPTSYRHKWQARAALGRRVPTVAYCHRTRCATRSKPGAPTS